MKMPVSTNRDVPSSENIEDKVQEYIHNFIMLEAELETILRSLIQLDDIEYVDKTIEWKEIKFNMSVQFDGFNEAIGIINFYFIHNPDSKLEEQHQEVASKVREKFRKIIEILVCLEHKKVVEKVSRGTQTSCET